MATIDTIANRSTGSAIAGKAYFETSTNKFIVFNGTAWIEIDSDGTGAAPFENRWGASFDGSNDYMETGVPIVTGTSPISMSGWVYLTSTPVNYAQALAIRGSRSEGTARMLGFRFGRLYFNTYLSELGGTTTLSLNTWYHIAATCTSSGAAKVYLNGVQEASSNVTYNSVASGNTFTIGLGGTSEYLPAKIDEAAIWDSELSQADITKIYNGTAPNGKPTDLTLAASYDTDRTSNLKGYWRMGDDSSDTASANGSIATITDSSGNGNDATQGTASKQPTFKALAQSTTSISFDGSDYLQCGTSSDFDVSSGFSISAWLKPNSSSPFNMIAYRRTGANGYQFFSNNSVLQYYGGNGNQTLNTALNVNQWNHVVLVHTGSQITGYVNGVAGATLTDSYTSPGTTDFYVGRHPLAASYNIEGSADEFAFFNTALSAPDVASLAASRGAHIVNDLSLSPVAYYRMGEDDSLTDGATVTGISDASGNGNHATTQASAQPTASVEPIIYV